MRIYRRLAGAFVLIAALCVAAEPSVAQSLLQRLFGFGGSRSPEYRDGRMGGYGFSSRRYGDDEYWEEDLGTYRTLCVRLCDGFYFPIGDNVRRGRLYRDNRACMQRCDGDARLFYYPTEGGSPETMIDLAGRSYKDLPSAFRYRKALVAGCTCRPAPWSAVAAARHEGYAAEAVQSVADAQEEAEINSGRVRQAAGPSVDEPYYFEPPRPYVPRPRNYSRWRRAPWDRDGWRD
jgi:hypothetical protein